VLTIRHLMRQQSADNDTLAAALCAYAVLVLLWACAYSLLETLDGRAFSYSGATADVPQIMHFGFGDSMMSIYYSFVTITTLGYGDVTPVTSFARMLASLQAFLGQAFVAILVARLVGLKLAESLSSDQS
ncbi:MAG: potassium channel family protein, partial [Gammaproteobacteria bacterium]